MLILNFFDKKSSHPMMTEFLFAYVPKSCYYLGFRNIVFDNDFDCMVVCCLTEDFIGFFNFT